LSDILVKHAIVVTLDKDRRIIRDAAIKIDKNRISEIGSTKDLEKKYGAREIIDASGKAVLPGFVNAHTHLGMTFGRSLAYDNYLMDWLKVQKLLASQFTSQDWELVELLGCIENIKNGNTCISDVNSATHDSYQGSVDEICVRALERTGIRGILSRGYHDDKSYFPAFAEAIVDIINRVEKLIQEWDKAANGRIRIQLAPTVPWACSPQLFRETREMADKHGVRIHLHTAETPDYNTLVKQKFGYGSNIEYLSNVGNLGPDVQLNHAVWLSDSDLKKVAETKSNVIHNPVSNMILASGISRVPEMVALGINVGLGCDGPACNNNQDTISNMKFASLLHKVTRLDPTVITAKQVLEMATINSAKALGLENNIGSLEPGKKADLITINLKASHVVPVLDVIGAIVYSSNGGDVNDVIIDGELIMKDRVIRTVNEYDILERAQKASEDCLQRAALSNLMVPQRSSTSEHMDTYPKGGNKS
jgi:5-methylthioadenosine/S-adenosylhomocysteine deaminase